MKKNLVLVLMAALCMFGLTACGSEKQEAAAPAPEAPAAAQQLVVATSPDFPPFESLGENNAVEGIEIDILNLICEKLGMELVIEQVDFDSVLPGVQSGKYNLGASGISITEQRQKNVLFTDPYCLAAQAIVVTKESPITCKADLDGKKVAVQTGTTAESFCMENGYTVDSYVANNDAQSALLTGKVDAWVIDDLTAADMVKAYNGESGDELVILDEAMTTEPYAFAMAFGNEETIASINEVLNGLVADGTVAATFEKFEAPYTAPNAQ